MDWPRTFIAGLKAAAMGSLIGTSIPSIIATGLGIALLAEGGVGSLFLVFLPFLVGLFGAIVGLLLCLLPLTIWLQKRQNENRRVYLTSGLIAGGVSTCLIMLWMTDGDPFAILFFGAFGVFTGGATGHFWWRYARETEVDSGLDRIVETFG